MGYGEFIEQDFSNDTTINLTLFSRFHEPLVWEQGMVNVTITYGNETVWSYQTSDTNSTDFTIELNRSGTYVIEVLSEGSDDPTTSDPAMLTSRSLRQPSGRWSLEPFEGTSLLPRGSYRSR